MKKYIRKADVILLAVLLALGFAASAALTLHAAPAGADAIFIVATAIGTLNIIFRTVVLNGLRKTFGKKWGWMILFLFVPGLTLAFYGYSKRIKV